MSKPLRVVERGGINHGLIVVDFECPVRDCDAMRALEDISSFIGEMRVYMKGRW
jgi:hypothetical protein